MRRRQPLFDRLESRTLFAGNVSAIGGVPLLSSNPGAAVKIYLDFDGEAASTWNTLSVPRTPAYDTDGDPTTFNNAGDSNLHTELENIRRIWSSVAEKFSPFNVDVTTVNPGSFADKQALHVVIGGDGEWVGTYGGWGGASTTGAFYTASSNTIYAFSQDFGGVVKWVADSIAMQCGRAFGLQNQSIWNDQGIKTSQFNSGNSLLAPLMGDPSGSARGNWWYGTSSLSDYDFATSKSTPRMQDDLSILAGSNNGFGFRADDHGNATSAATTLAGSGGTFTGSGVIETVGDSDYFSFTTTGGTVTLTGNVAAYGAMLNLKLSVFNTAGQLVGSADSAALSETLNLNLSAGTYYIAIAGHGWVSAGQGQGSGADIGQYSLEVLAPIDISAAPDNLTATATSRDQITLRWRDNSFDEFGYVIDMATDSGFTQDVKTVVVGPDVIAYSTRYLNDGTTYYFRVCAIGPFGDTEHSHARATTWIPGDVNLDGRITGDDLAAADSSLGTISGATWRMGDMNGDGVVTGDDMVIIDANYSAVIPLSQS